MGEVGGLTVDAAVLTPLVRAALDDERARLADWRVEQLRAGAGNPASGGLYRVAGTANAEGEWRDWRLILKVAQSPASVGWLDFGEEPEHWNYWLREVRAYQAGLLADLPGGMSAPRYYGSTEAGDRAWLWIEDIGALERSAWTAAACRRAAWHLGAFEGAFLAGRSFPRRPWLADGLLRAWSHFATPMAPALRTLSEPDGPFREVRRLVGSRRVDALVECLAEQGPLLGALDRVTHAPSHQDANIDNLQLRAAADGTSRLVAIDWQLMGHAPVGAVVGQLLASLGEADGPSIWAEDVSVLAAYAEGLAHAGAVIDAARIRLAYLASTVLRQGTFMFYSLARQLQGAGVQATDEAGRALIDQLADANVQTLVRLALLNEEARPLLAAG